MPEERFKRDLIARWYDQYSAPIFKYIVKMIKDVHRAEDLTQDTFIKAYKYIDAKTEVTYPKTFLYRIAHNITVDYLRKKAPINMVEDFLIRKKDSGPSVENIIEIREESRELYEALSSLKTTYRQVIILRKIEAFSVQETAHILNWSESKVKSTLFRALRNLEKQLIKGGVINETS